MRWGAAKVSQKPCHLVVKGPLPHLGGMGGKLIIGVLFPHGLSRDAVAGHEVGGGKLDAVFTCKCVLVVDDALLRFGCHIPESSF